MLLELFQQITDSSVVAKAETQTGPVKEKIKGVKGAVTVSAQRLCPEMCFRFQEHGTCVHLDKTVNVDKTFTAEFTRQREERKLKRIREHKDNEKPSQWCVVTRDDWKTLPLTYGVYVWVDASDRIVYYAKAVDMKRRHYTWAMLVKSDARWLKTAKIWWLHTGWYEELVEALVILKRRDIAITFELLDELTRQVRPIELALPEPPSL